MIQVQDTVTFVADVVAGLGVDVETLTVTIANRDRVAQEVLGPVNIGAGLPAWLTRQEVGGSVSYTVDYAADDEAYDYPPDHVILSYDAVLPGAVVFPQLTRVVQIGGAALPAVPTGREPYADVDYADAYFGSRIDGRVWEALTPADRLRALVTASDDVDAEVFKGLRRFVPTTESGAFSRRQFPRLFTEFAGLTDLTIDVDDDEIPLRVKDATCAQALYLARTALRGQDPNDIRNLQQLGVTGRQRGRLNLTWDIAKAADHRLCVEATDLLRPFLAVTVPVGWGQGVAF